jgi:hypothetical protein
MAQLSEFTKKVGARELMDKRRETSASSFFYIQPGKKTFGESYMESESGKALSEQAGKSLKSGSPEATSQLVLSQMGTAIAQGILSPAQARSIVANLAKQIKNTQFGIDINAKITSLFGPDGTPLSVSKNSIKLALDAVTTISNTNADDATKGSAVNESTIAAMNAIQSATDALALNEKATDKDKQDLTTYTQQTMQTLFDNIVSTGNTGQTAQAARDALTEAYKDTGFQDTAKAVGDAVQNFSGFSDQQEIFFTQLLASKTLGTTQMQNAMNMNISGDTLLELLKTNPTAINQLLGIAGSMDRGQGTALINNQVGQTSEEIASTASALELTNKTTGVFEMDETSKKAVQEYYAGKGLNEAKEIDRIYKELDGKKTTITVDTVTTVAGTNSELAKAMKDGKVSGYFNKLKDKKNKIIFTTEFNSLIKADKELIPAIKLWASTARKDINMSDTKLLETYKIEYAFSEAKRVTQAGALQDLTVDPNDTNDEKQGPDPSILDPYVKMLREANNWQQKLTTGWNDSYKAIMKYGNAAVKQMGGIAVLMKAQGADAEIIRDFMNGTEEEQNRIVDKKTGKLRANAGALLKKLKEIKDASEIGLTYVLATPAERLAKDNELYQAGLDVISNKEKKINDKYDKRIKALDEIGKIQEKNNQRQQDTLTLADALSKGDIAAAARAALQAKQNDQKQALNDAKDSIENARKIELEGVEVRINGVLTDRTKLEAILQSNAEKIAGYKLKEEQYQYNIEQNALKSAKHMASILKDGKALALIKPYNPTTGSSGSNSSGNKDEDTKKDAKGNPIGTKYDAKGKISKDGKYNDQGKLIKPETSAAELSKLKKAASTAGLKAEATKANTASTAAQVSAASTYKLDAYKLSNAVRSGNMQSIYADVKESQRAAFTKDFAKLVGLQDTVESYYDPTGMANILNSAAGKEASENLLNALPEETKNVINLIKNRFTSYNTELADYLAKQKAYKDAAGKLGVGNVKWKDMTPDNKAKLQTVYTAYNKKVAFMFNRHKQTNDAIDQIPTLIQQGIDLGSVGLNATTKKTDIANKEVRSWGGFASGGMVIPKGYAIGGGIYGTDTVPAMLTPGEFVVRKAAVDSIGIDKLNSMNSGTSVGESVYNYSITVNANSSDANDIADAVLRQIKRVDSQRLRSNVL